MAERHTVTAENARAYGSFVEFRKVGSTLVSDFTMPPGVSYQTPEGLRAEDEETRIAFDSQGGVYPIRESVFRESYERLTVSETWILWACPECDYIEYVGDTNDSDTCHGCGFNGYEDRDGWEPIEVVRKQTEAESRSSKPNPPPTQGAEAE